MPPHPPPPYHPPLFSSLVQLHPPLLSEPNDLHAARLSAEVMPALTVGKGAAPLGGGWSARGRHRGKRRRRHGSLTSHNEATRGRAASRAVAPPPLPQDFAPEPAVSARGLGERGEGRGAPRRRGGALASLIGICGPNGTADAPGYA